MIKLNWTLKGRGVAMLIAAVVMAVLGLRPSDAAAREDSEGAEREPIVGLWQVTFTDTATKDLSYAWDA
jgi:hypothetical protein